MSNHLPMTRVKTIMKSSADVDSISKESLLLVTVATEIFIKHLAMTARIQSMDKPIDYKYIAEIVDTEERYDFLKEIIPKKITVRQFKQMLQDRKASHSATDDSENSESEDSDSSSSDSDNNSENPESICNDDAVSYSSVIIIDPDTELSQS